MVTAVSGKKDYIRAVRRRLICPPRERAQLTERLEQMVDAFLEDNPNADAEAWTCNLGSPEEMAAELLSECDPELLFQERRKRKILQYLAMGALLVLALAAILYIVFHPREDGHIEVYPWVYYMTDEIPTPPPDGEVTIIYDFGDD